MLAVHTLLVVEWKVNLLSVLEEVTSGRKERTETPKRPTKQQQQRQQKKKHKKIHKNPQKGEEKPTNQTTLQNRNINKNNSHFATNRDELLLISAEMSALASGQSSFYLSR